MESPPVRWKGATFLVVLTIKAHLKSLVFLNTDYSWSGYLKVVIDPQKM